MESFAEEFESSNSSFNSPKAESDTKSSRKNRKSKDVENSQPPRRKKLKISDEKENKSDGTRDAMQKQTRRTSSVLNVLQVNHKHLNVPKKMGHKITKPGFQCHICKESLNARNDYFIYRHYVFRHYKEQMMGLFDGKTSNCPYCKAKFTNTRDALCHIAYTHKKLDNFLPKRFHSKNTEIGQDFVCGHCGARYDSRDDLYEHYSCVHYKKELRAQIDKEAEGCVFCDIPFHNFTAKKKIRHVGVDHLLVEHFLPEHLHITGDNELNKENTANLSPQDEKDSTPEINGENESFGGRNSFQCHICGSLSKSRYKLYGHYALVHYREQLNSYVNMETMSCTICGFSRDKRERLILHIGATHDKVEDFIPIRFPRLRVGRPKVQGSQSSPDTSLLCEGNQEAGDTSFEDYQEVGDISPHCEDYQEAGNVSPVGHLEEDLTNIDHEVEEKEEKEEVIADIWKDNGGEGQVPDDEEEDESVSVVEKRIRWLI